MIRISCIARMIVIHQAKTLRLYTTLRLYSNTITIETVLSPAVEIYRPHLMLLMYLYFPFMIKFIFRHFLDKIITKMGYYCRGGLHALHILKVLEQSTLDAYDKAC